MQTRFVNLLKRWFKLRFAILYPFGIFIALSSHLTARSLCAGIGFLIAGLLLRLWANGYAIKMDRLTTSGPYAFLRHPLYLGTFLVAAGLTIMLMPAYVGIPFMLVMLTVYCRTIKKEEQMLETKFKQSFLEYKRSVPALFPRLSSYRGGEKWPFSFKRLIENREYKLFFWVIIIVIAFYWKSKVLVEHQPMNARLWVLVFVALLLGLTDLTGELVNSRRKRLKRTIAGVLFFCCVLASGTIPAAGAAPEPPREIEITAKDRILILAPHPDDEILGCAGIIQKAKALGIPLRIVFLTYGDNNQWSFLVYRKHPVFMPRAVKEMGLVRYREAHAATRILGVAPEQLVFLGYPDFHTLSIWYRYWGTRRPFASMLTHAAAVPYRNAFRPGAPYTGEAIVGDLESVLRDFAPTKIFLSHPADHNPDHRALYLFTRVALWDLQDTVSAEVYPYLIHYKKWPKPHGYYPEKSLEVPQSLKEKIAWQTSALSLSERTQKYRALQKHRSQFISSAAYLCSFVRTNELFGDFPIVALRADEIVSLSPSERTGDLEELPEELTKEERVAFVGIEKHAVRLEDNRLIISITLSRPLGKEVGVSVYAFGYRRDVAFAAMPKLHVKFGTVRYKVFDQARRLPAGAIRVTRRAREITLSIPLSLLNDPQYILLSTQTYIGVLPLDGIAWQALEVRH